MVVRKRLRDFLVSAICKTAFAKLLPKIQGTVMIDELILLYRGMGQHDKALDVRRTSFSLIVFLCVVLLVTTC